MDKKLFNKVLSFLFATFILGLNGCSKNDSNENNDENIFTEPLISVDPNISFLFSAKLEDNQTIEYYGDKDTNGVPTRCNLIKVDNAVSEESVLISLDNESRPTEVIGSDGSALQFNYDDINNINVNVIYPGNEYNISFNLNDNADKTGHSKNGIKGSGTRKGKKIELVTNVSSPGAMRNFCDEAPNRVKVRVNKCGVPQGNPYRVFLKALTEETNTVNPTIPVDVRAANENNDFCFKVSKGNYVLDQDAVQNICSAYFLYEKCFQILKPILNNSNSPAKQPITIIKILIICSCSIL